MAGLVLCLVASCSSGGPSDNAGSTAGPSAGAEPSGAGNGDGPPSGPASSADPGGGSRPDHVMVVIFENEDATDVLGSGDAPFLTSLAASAATFTDAHGETHPSQPNYLALFSGSTYGVTDDACPQKLSGNNLAGQLADAGWSFVGYSEDLPRPGYTGCQKGDYARKHAPWVNFQGLPASVNQPLSAMPADYARLPTVSFVVPNLCNDMHDCGVAAGDAWAEKNIADYASWATSHNSLLLVTFDEDSGTSDNHIATIVAGAGVQPTISDQYVDHYSILRTLEDMYGLTPLAAAADAEPMADAWHAAGR